MAPAAAADAARGEDAERTPPGRREPSSSTIDVRLLLVVPVAVDCVVWLGPQMVPLPWPRPRHDEPGWAAVTLRTANRLFVAADLPEEARTRLARAGAELAERAGGRPVPAANLHVTLDFLGRVPAGAGAALVEAVRRALAGPPVRVALGGLRARPRAARARLVAVELVDPEDALAARARRVRAAVDPVLGREPGDAAFWPHVTVMRLGRPARLGPLGAIAGREQVFDVSRGALYDSHQSPDGPPRHRELVAVEFSPSP